MPNQSTRRHVFISHHHRDDAEVQKLTDMLGRRGYDVRNSSIRAKPENQRRLDQGRVKDETIRRLLRMKIAWASTTVVLIGKDTHGRPWVNWEIEQANRQGKRIVGVFTRNGTENDIPPSFEKYGTALAGWRSDSVMAAIDGVANPFERPDGSPRQGPHRRNPIVC